MTDLTTHLNWLLSYDIASSDMRHIKINEREIYLRNDPRRGLVLQGEIPECGPDCHANLSQMLLEFGMSCEDCRNQEMTSSYVEDFGIHLGDRLFVTLDGILPPSPDVERLRQTMAILLNSMDVPFEGEVTTDRMLYELAYCPIRAAAKSSGLSLWIPAGHKAFVALCTHLVRKAAPVWVLKQPSESHTDVPLDNILIVAA